MLKLSEIEKRRQEKKRREPLFMMRGRVFDKRVVDKHLRGEKYGNFRDT